jgi:hypothetical protein
MRRLLQRFPAGISCREDDASEGLGAELLQEAGVRRQDAAPQNGQEER